MSTFSREKFKQNLLDKGIDLSDQQINHFISLKQGSTTIPQINESMLTEDIFGVIENWEDGDRSRRHNNPGAHIWSPERAKLYGAKKGDPFVDSEGITRHTAKYDTFQQGADASRSVTNSIMKLVKHKTGLNYDDPEFSKAFAQHYTGLSDESASLENYSDSIQNAILKRQYPQQEQQGMSELPPVQESPWTFPEAREDLSDPFGINQVISDIDYGQFQSAEQRNSVVDFLGNSLWNFLDTSTFGALGAADYEDYIQDFLTGEHGPTTFAGRTGAGIGGALGFLAPMRAVGLGARAAVSAGKYGTKTFSKKVAEEGSRYLGKQVAKGKGYKKFNKLSEADQKSMFKRMSDDVLKETTKFPQQTVDKAFAKTLTKNSDKAIVDALKTYKLPPSAANVKNIKGILQTALAGHKKSVLPISTLQQRIALALGGTQGSNKIATIASHLLEEGLLFAAVETPMEVFQSINEDRELDLLGRAKHAFLLGNALGVVRFIPGGKTWIGADGQKSSISREGFRKAMRMVSKKQPYSRYDMSNPRTGEILRVQAENTWSNLGKGASDFFKNSFSKVKDLKADDIPLSVGDLARHSRSEQGRKMLARTLDDAHVKWEADWGKAFRRGVMEDLTGSTPRMIAGAMAFNHEVVFDDRVPLEDKVFNILLGAFMTKQKRGATYRTKEGKLETLISEQPYVSHNYDKVVKYLDGLNMSPTDALYTKMAKNLDQRDKVLRNAADSKDIQSIIKILEKNGVLQNEQVNNPNMPRKNLRGATGSQPLYDMLRDRIDGDVIPVDGKRMLAAEYITKAKLDKIVKDINKLTPESIGKNVVTPSDLSDLIFHASDKSMTQLSNTNRDAAIAIWNHLSKGKKGEIDIPETGARPTVFNIISDGNLTTANKEILKRYQLLIRQQNGIGVAINQEKGSALRVNNKSFEGIRELIARYDGEQAKIVEGQSGVSDGTVPGVGQEGYVSNMIQHHHSFKGIRVAHELLTDFKSPRWSESKLGAEPHGQQAEALETKIFHNYKQDVLFDKVEFGPNVNSRIKTFVEAYHKIKMHDPNANTPFLEGQGQTLRIETSTDKAATRAKELLRLFEKNGISGFSHSDPGKVRDFTERLIAHNVQRHLHSAVKTDGAPINDLDIAVISKLIDKRVIGPNFQVLQVKAIIDNFRAPGASVRENMKNVENLFNRQFSNKQTQTILNENASLDRMFEMFKIYGGQDKPLTVKELVTTWQEILEPYLKDGTGRGVLKESSRTIAEVEFSTMIEWINSLRSLKTIRDIKTHQDLLEQFDMYSKNKEFNGEQRLLLSHIYRNLGRPNVNTKSLIEIMAAKKLYNLSENKATIDSKIPGLSDRLNEIVRSEDFDLYKPSNDNVIENNIREYEGRFKKDNDVDVYINTSRQSVQKTYHLSENYNFKENLKPDDKGVPSIVKDAFIESEGKKLYYYGKEGPYGNKGADGEMKFEQKQKLLNDIIKLNHSYGQQRQVSRVMPSESGNWTDFEYTLYDNSAFRHMDNLLALPSIKRAKGDNGWLIIDPTFTDASHKKLSIEENKAVKTSFFSALDNNYLYDHKLSINKITDTPYYQKTAGNVYIGLGNLKFGIGIGKDRLPALGENLDFKIEKWKKDYKGESYDKIHKTIETVFNDTFSKTEIEIDGKKTGKFTYQYKGKNNTAESQKLELLVTQSYLDNNLKQLYWDFLRKTHKTNEGLQTAKFLRRIKLMANTSMKELTTDHINYTSNLLKGLYGKDAKAKMKGLDRIKKNNGFKILLAADENFDIGEASILKQLQKQIDASQAANKDVNLLNVKANDKFEGGLEFWFGKDISSVDSYTAVRPEIMQALYQLVGAGDVTGLGGAKPIIHKYGDAVLIGKTAFISDPKFNKFFKENDVDMVMMESAAKLKQGFPALTDWGGMDQLAGKKLEGKELDLVKTIGINEISLGQVVNSYKKAAIPQQSFKDLNAKESREVYEWLFEDKISEYDRLTSEVFNPKTDDAISLAKFFNEGRATENANSLYERAVKHGMNPLSPLFKDEFMNVIKSNRLDKAGVFTAYTKHGIQSVTSPATPGIRFPEFTINGDKISKVTGYDHSVYTFGQGDLSFQGGQQKVKRSRLHFIEHNTNSKDKIIKASDLKDLTIEADSKLVDVMKKLKDYNKKNNTDYSVAAVWRRNPNTRPGDMVIAGIRDVLPADYGNTSRLNQYDFAFRLEGDNDIDKMDVFWDAPTNILKKWEAISGAVIRVNPHGEANKKTLKFGEGELDILAPGAPAQHRNDVFNSEKLRGRIIKVQRVLQGISEYDNNVGKLLDSEGKSIKGLTLDLAGGKGGLLYIDQAALKEAKKTLAEDIQNVTDAETGYDKTIYNDKWEKKFYFGDGARYDGIFRLADWNESIRRWEPSQAAFDISKQSVYQDIIIEAIAPYKRLLQLGTNVYSEGAKKSVEYQDIMSYVNKFDGQMAYLSSNIYWKLRNGEYNNKIGQLNEIFLNDAGKKAEANGQRLISSKHFNDVFGGWGDKIRPNLRGETNFENMLPFERNMAELTFNDNSKISRPKELFGEELNEFENFYSKHFNDQDFDHAASEFISNLKKNDKYLNQLNYLTWQLDKQKNARNNAYRRGNKGLGDSIQESIAKTSQMKSEIESEMIVPQFEGAKFEKSDYTAHKYANNIRNTAIKEVWQDMYRSGSLPKGWDNNASRPKSFDTYRGVQAWANSKEGRSALYRYIGKQGPIKFKGVNTETQLELQIWHNHLEPLTKLVIGDGELNGEFLRREMREHVRGFKKDYGKIWSDVMQHKDPIHDKVRANAEVMEQLNKRFDYWEEQGGYGRLFILKLMAPETQAQTFSYLKLGDKGHVMPSFKSESLSMLKLGLRFWNQTDRIDSPSKEQFFNYISNWHNKSFQAFHGKRFDATDLYTLKLSELKNEAQDILRASPLLDDIVPYDYAGGIQQQNVNPHVARAMGIEPNQSVASVFASEPLFPNYVKKLNESTLMSYMPRAYINAGSSGRAHPAIHGYKSYNKAVEGDAVALLGDALYSRNLVFDKAINHFKGAYEGLPEASKTGKSEAKSIIETKERNNPLDDC